eukprot:TRINITY_DN12545_c0_g1_i1.p1 TRINITY_DN12545_c0_g1~~TRINITY_DN12545_c0_g1_i1.p1  ORF type:complete len:374 (-),score=77.82 TRINITY_DN12545_c0_g1_i1:140-1192(-)
MADEFSGDFGQGMQSGGLDDPYGSAGAGGTFESAAVAPSYINPSHAAEDPMNAFLNDPSAGGGALTGGAGAAEGEDDQDDFSGAAGATSFLEDFFGNLEFCPDHQSMLHPYVSQETAFTSASHGAGWGVNAHSLLASDGGAAGAASTQRQQITVLYYKCLTPGCRFLYRIDKPSRQCVEKVVHDAKKLGERNTLGDSKGMYALWREDPSLMRRRGGAKCPRCDAQEAVYFHHPLAEPESAESMVLWYVCCECKEMFSPVDCQEGVTAREQRDAEMAARERDEQEKYRLAREEAEREAMDAVAMLATAPEQEEEMEGWDDDEDAGAADTAGAAAGDAADDTAAGADGEGDE